jgi:hypothetical protein
VEIALSAIASLALLVLYLIVGAVSRRVWRTRGHVRGHVAAPMNAPMDAQATIWRRALAELRAAAEHDGITQRALLVCAVALAAVVLSAYWFGYDMQATSVRAALVNDPVPALGAYLEHALPANATVLIPTDNSLVRAGYLDPQVGRVQLMVYAHRDVYSIDAVTTNAICQIAAETAQVGSPTVMFTDARFDGTAIGPAHGVDGWTLYAPRCG